jgi:UDPglucose 6-dehydrogenase
MRIGVIGTGHVGLVTCATLAHLGHEVVGTDSDEKKIESLQSGISPFYEPGLENLLANELASGRLRFTSDPQLAVSGSEVVFICVGTPPRASGEANLVAVESAARVVARHASPNLAVVEKSTVPAGTSHRVKATLKRERPDLAPEIDVVSNPEFLREGKAVEDSLGPDRILVGAESSGAFERMRNVYRPLIDAGVPLFETSLATAELAKHASNAFLALKISFMNSMARICERSGADVADVAAVMGADERIGSAFLNAGLGYGGSCFPKDIRAFERLSSDLGYRFGLLREIAHINDEAIEAILAKLREACWNLEDKRVALLGLAFKPGTDDVREAPALKLATRLLGEGAAVVGYDPQAAGNAEAEVPGLETAADPYDALSGAHCMVVCTEWEEFGELDLNKVKEIMAYPIVVDGRNLFDGAVMKAAGFSYYPTGKPAVH